MYLLVFYMYLTGQPYCCAMELAVFTQTQPRLEPRLNPEPSGHVAAKASSIARTYKCPIVQT